MNPEQYHKFSLEMTEKGIHHDFWCDHEEEWLEQQNEHLKPKKETDLLEEIATITINGLEQHKFEEALNKINQLFTRESLKG